MYLLDTMVLSELRKTRRDARLVAWLGKVPAADLRLSVVTIGEVEKGIAKQQRQDPAFAERLAHWFDLVLRQPGAGGRRGDRPDQADPGGVKVNGSGLSPSVSP